nr:MAG TPA: hypothetical protein [Caudoviricetes sp.]
MRRKERGRTHSSVPAISRRDTYILDFSKSVW